MDSVVGTAAAVDEGLACSAALRLAAPTTRLTDFASHSRCRGWYLVYDIHVYH